MCVKGGGGGGGGKTSQNSCNDPAFCLSACRPSQGRITCAPAIRTIEACHANGFFC